MDKTGTWSLGESMLWYSPSAGLDVTWSLGESYLLDDFELQIQVVGGVKRRNGLLLGVY